MNHVIHADVLLCGDCLHEMQAMPSDCVDMTMCSPPYEDARLYLPMEFTLSGQEWVDWMAVRVVEMCRVTDGLVFVNMAGKRRDWKYSPVVEWLVADLTRQHGIVCGPAPYVFYRIGIPGSGSGKYHRRDWEPVYAFARPEKCPPKWTDNTAMGHAPKWAPGGEMSHRLSDGTRCNAWGKSPKQIACPTGPRQANGERDTRPRAAGGTEVATLAEHKRLGTGQNLKGGCGTMPLLADPGNVIQSRYTAEEVADLLGEPSDVVKCLVGGGVMGDRLCHENEAPYPESLCEFFIRSFCQPGGIVLDPYSGSGTTVSVAKRTRRRWIGIDARQSQVDIASERLSRVQPELFG